MTENQSRTFEAFKELVPYLRGALWWARNDLIKQRHPEFNQNDNRIGHPLLSVRQCEVERRFDVIPMLVGTSGRRSNCVVVSGMTSRDRDHKTYFGTIVLPGHYSFEDMRKGMSPSKVDFVSHEVRSFKRKSGERGYMRKEAWHRSRTMFPNWEKPMVSEDEKRDLDNWCKAHSREEV